MRVWGGAKTCPRKAHTGEMTRRRSSSEDIEIRTEYLKSILAPTLGISPIFSEIRPPSYGAKSELLLVWPREDAPFVLRFLDDPGEAATLFAASRLAEAQNLPTPRLRYADLSRRHLREHGFSVLVEEMIEGEHLESGAVSPEHLEQLGRSLACVHRVSSDRWGTPGRRRWGNFFNAAIAKKFKYRLTSLKRFDPELTRSRERTILKFVDSFRSQWDQGPPYALTHDKINIGNVIFTKRSDVYFLDLISMRYGAPGKDLATTLYYFCEDQTEEARLLKFYFAVLPAFEDHFRKFEPLYRAWVHLSRWTFEAKYLQRYARRDGVTAPSADRAGIERERDMMWNWLEKRVENPGRRTSRAPV